MTIDRVRLSAAAGLCLLLCACGPRDMRPADAEATSPVTGRVHVDGSPAGTLEVICHRATPEGGFAMERKAMTDPEGAFAFTTYLTGDGLRAGDYVLTFVWYEGYEGFSFEPIGRNKLAKRYEAPGQSTVSFTVEPGKPVDLGLIELETK